MKSQDKPVVKLMASGRRQFSPSFKIMIVKHCARLRREHGGKGAKNGVKEYLEQYQLDPRTERYWKVQYAQGHFMPDRAVAFSRKPTMIRV